jgi:hypothetical protein
MTPELYPAFSLGRNLKRERKEEGKEEKAFFHPSGRSETGSGE